MLVGSGVSSGEITRMMRIFRHGGVKCQDEGDDQAANENICSVLKQGIKSCTLFRLQQSAASATIAALTGSGIPLSTAWDIVHNNPILLTLNVGEIESLCRELVASGVDIGDFASILSQHLPQNNATRC
ncbi:uncharacterized protein BXIN_0502 [Babesia sp. Xinjiang]|uniref:uncharacterized protein n=1 Tax=Babesia sp. Xinjiang TaxID=462227 RepID=UPI000A25A101|nr:uncharacterized protein BXIN_0502 [Babesia sp. Xinjiang]ORM41881.1 hypothetical protein BXIN_0502 [Babesia sp. Xinjiang]